MAAIAVSTVAMLEQRDRGVAGSTAARAHRAASLAIIVSQVLLVRGDVTLLCFRTAAAHDNPQQTEFQSVGRQQSNVCVRPVVFAARCGRFGSTSQLLKQRSARADPRSAPSREQTNLRDPRRAGAGYAASGSKMGSSDI